MYTNSEASLFIHNVTNQLNRCGTETGLTAVILSIKALELTTKENKHFSFNSQSNKIQY